MHPPLTLENHPKCREVVIAFKRCHDTNPIGKVFGACNDEKWALDACLREQKLWKARENLSRARASNERLKERRRREEDGD